MKLTEPEGRFSQPKYPDLDAKARVSQTDLGALGLLATISQV